MTEPETLTENFHHDTAEGLRAIPGGHYGGEGSTQSVAEHISSLLLSADGTARRIVEEAEAKAKDQLAEIERRVRWMEAETARLASWSRQTEEMIQALSSAVGDFRNDVEGVPQRISEALGPLASHVPVLVRQMNDLMGALTPPQSPGDPGESPAEPTWVAGWDERGDESH